MLYRIRPGQKHEVVREQTGGGNGTAFDLEGRLVLCEGDARRVTRMGADGRVEVLVDRFEGKRFPDGKVVMVADFEYPNGLAFSPDERLLYVANTRWTQYIHRIELDAAGNFVRRSIFADMSSDEPVGVPDGMKVDVEGRVYFGGPDLRTLFFTARTSIYTLRVEVPGQPQPRVR